MLSFFPQIPPLYSFLNMAELTKYSLVLSNLCFICWYMKWFTCTATCQPMRMTKTQISMLVPDCTRDGGASSWRHGIPWIQASGAPRSGRQELLPGSLPHPQDWRFWSRQEPWVRVKLPYNESVSSPSRKLMLNCLYVWCVNVNASLS